MKLNEVGKEEETEEAIGDWLSSLSSSRGEKGKTKSTKEDKSQFVRFVYVLFISERSLLVRAQNRQYCSLWTVLFGIITERSGLDRRRSGRAVPGRYCWSVKKKKKIVDDWYGLND